MSSSAYVLELTFGPGDRRDVLRPVTRPELLRAALEAFCANDGNQAAYLSIMVGGTLGLWVAQRGELTQFLDVAPFIRVDLGQGARTLDELWRDERALAQWGEAMDEADPWLERVTLELFWDPLAERLPGLDAPVLQPGETFVPHLADALRLAAPRSRLVSGPPRALTLT